MRSYGDYVDMTHQGMQGHNHSGIYGSGAGGSMRNYSDSVELTEWEKGVRVLLGIRTIDVDQQIQMDDYEYKQVNIEGGTRSIEGDAPWRSRWGADLAHMPGWVIDAHRRVFMDEAIYDPLHRSSINRPQSPEETKKIVPVRFRVKSPEELGFSYVDVKNRKKIYIDGLPVVYPVNQVLDADMVYTGEAWISENSGRISSVLFTDVSGNLRVIQSIIADIQEFLDVVPETGV